MQIGTPTWRSTIITVPFDHDWQYSILGKSYIFTADDNEAYQARAVYYGSNLTSNWSRVYWSTEWPSGVQLLCTSFATTDIAFNHQYAATRVGVEEYQLGIILREAGAESREQVLGLQEDHLYSAKKKGINQYPTFADRNYATGSTRVPMLGMMTDQTYRAGTTEIEEYLLHL